MNLYIFSVYLYNLDIYNSINVHRIILFIITIIKNILIMIKLIKLI